MEMTREEYQRFCRETDEVMFGLYCALLDDKGDRPFDIELTSGSGDGGLHLYLRHLDIPLSYRGKAAVIIERKSTWFPLLADRYPISRAIVFRYRGTGELSRWAWERCFAHQGSVTSNYWFEGVAPAVDDCLYRNDRVILTRT